MATSLESRSFHDKNHSRRLKRKRKSKDLVDTFVKNLNKKHPHVLAALTKNSMRLSKSKKGNNGVKDKDEENDENSKKAGELGSDRQFCDIVIKKADVKVSIEKKMIDMKFYKGKLAMVGTVQGEKSQCSLLDMGKCMSNSRNQLSHSAYFKALNMNDRKIRFSFHFFVGISREMGMCSVRVALKTCDNQFETRQKVMNYFPSEKFDVAGMTNQRSF